MMFFTVTGIIVWAAVSIIVVAALLGFVEVETEHTREEQ